MDGVVHTTACVSLLMRVATRLWRDMRRPRDRDLHGDQTAVVVLDLVAIMTTSWPRTGHRSCSRF